MREHEIRRLETERETGHPFHATKTDAVRSIFDPNHVADLERPRTPDLHGGTAIELAEDLEAYADEQGRQTLLGNLLARAAMKMRSMSGTLATAQWSAARHREDWAEAEQTVESLFRRDEFWWDTMNRISNLCDRADIAGIRSELHAARNMPHRVRRSLITEAHYR